jgi:hypothetical protein
MSPNCGRFVMVNAYSHELSCCGFWLGGGPIDEQAFYAYAYPEPKGFKDFPIRLEWAFYQKEMREFILPDDLVRTAKSPNDFLLPFLQSSYEAAAINTKWDRQALERQ